MSNDSLGDRMKGYEGVSRYELMRRTPVIIRIDGKAFHTWTRQLKDIDDGLKNDPFSVMMNQAMVKTTKLLVENIQNAKFGYTQSDEISILLNDWTKHETDQWFAGGVQKIASVAASMATAYFNQAIKELDPFKSVEGLKPAFFDARVFNVPMNEVTNYFIWRQQDASRNSVQMLARYHFSHQELRNKSNSDIQDMLMRVFKVNWNDLDTWKKRGTGIVRFSEPEITWRALQDKSNRVVADYEIPIFTKDRDYIEKHLLSEKEREDAYTNERTNIPV